MVGDRNRQIIERRRSGESFSAIGSALGISRERVREIVEREERRDRRARELEEAAHLPQQPNPLQLPPRLRNMLLLDFGKHRHRIRLGLREGGKVDAGIHD
jgi:hypothetical protein